MRIQLAKNHAQNSHNQQTSLDAANSVNCVHELVHAQTLLEELRALGVQLSIADGRLAYDAPAGVLTSRLLQRMRDHRDALLQLLEPSRPALTEERLEPQPVDLPTRPPPPAEPASPTALPPMNGVLCPWCRSKHHLFEKAKGIDCGNCGRQAWRFEGESIVRCDWSLEPLLKHSASPVLRDECDGAKLVDAAARATARKPVFTRWLP